MNRLTPLQLRWLRRIHEALDGMPASGRRNPSLKALVRTDGQGALVTAQVRPSTDVVIWMATRRGADVLARGGAL